ncbi:MAG: oligosaccharide flippase family protein [Planctomycetota bacterium]
MRSRCLTPTYKEPVLVALVPVTGLVLVIVSFQSPGIWLAQRRVEVWRLTSVDVVTQTATLATMIAWAAVSPTVWALAAGVVVSGIVRVGASYVVARSDRPRFRLDRDACGSILRFGGWLIVGTLLTFLATDLPTLALGRAFTKEDLAVFTVALMLATFSSQCVSKIAALVVFPLFSEVKNVGGDIASAAGRVLEPLRVLAGAATAAMYASGPMAVVMLWPVEYANAAWMVRLLAVMAILIVLGESLKMLLLSLGEARPTIWGHVSKLLALAVLMPTGAWWTSQTMGWALPGFVAGAALSEVARYLAFSVLTRRYGVRSLMRDLVWFAVMAVGAMLSAIVADAAHIAAAAQGWDSRVAAGVGGLAGCGMVSVVFALPVLVAIRDVRGLRG